MSLRYLAGDIGGTISRLLLVERRWLTEQERARYKRKDEDEPVEDGHEGPLDDEGCVETVVARKTYPSKKYPHLTVIIEQFLKEVHGPTPAACALAVAGPVDRNQANLTNLNWFLDGSAMAEALHVGHVQLLNDFAAIGYGLLALKPSEYVCLTQGVKRIPKAPIACLGAGTGLGETFLTFNGTEYDVWPTEGGHCSFSSRNEFEFGLMSFIKESERLPSVSVERLVSGPAFPKIYQYLAKRFPDIINPTVHNEVVGGLKDPSQAITSHGLNGDTLCALVLDTFVKLYGSEAGNLALKTLPFNGLFIAGGIASQIFPAMVEQNKFVENMLDKGRMRKDLEKVPVFLVQHPEVGLLGARVISRRLLREPLTQLRRKLDPSNTSKQLVAAGASAMTAVPTSPPLHSHL